MNEFFVIFFAYMFVITIILCAFLVDMPKTSNFTRVQVAFMGENS